MKKKLWWIFAILVLITAGVFIVRSFIIKNSDGQSSVQTVPVVRRDIGSSVLATGIIKPRVGAEVKVGSRVSGVVKRLRAQIGDLVEAGQVIAELDDAEFKAKLDQNVAALERAEADLEYAGVNLERQRSLLKKISPRASRSTWRRMPIKPPWPRWSRQRRMSNLPEFNWDIQRYMLPFPV
jgi:multidrug efflux pump subunit AcrA (membrane-fusion protein)